MARGVNAERSLNSHCVTCPPPQAFIKLVNYTHMMPTRYNLDGDLKVRPRSLHPARHRSLRDTAAHLESAIA